MEAVLSYEVAAARLSAAVYYRKETGVDRDAYYSGLVGTGQINNYVINDSATAVLWLDSNLEVCQKLTLFVAYEGTTDLSDWLSNAKAGSRNVPGFGGRMRRGFYDHTRKTWRAIRRYLREHRVEAVVFTGHSLGGACANGAAALTMATFPHLQNTIHCVTFGAPRVWRPDAASLFNDDMNGRHTRFVKPYDPVPRVPTMFLYRHGEGRFLLDGDNTVRGEITSSVRAWRKNMTSLVVGVASLAREHSMPQYLEDILELPILTNAPLPSPTDGYRLV